MAPHATTNDRVGATTGEAVATKPIPRPCEQPDPSRELATSVNPPNFSNKHIKIVPLASTFVAEVRNVNFAENPLNQEVIDEIVAAIEQYGVLVFRNTGLDDHRHVQFSAQLGELDSAKRDPNDLKSGKLRFPYDTLFDAGNLDAFENIIQAHERRYLYNKGNALWHVDSSFNKRRASYSLLLAHAIPPAGTGGETDFADMRAAYDDLPDDKKAEMEDLVLGHSLWHSRKIGYPEYEPNEFDLQSKPPCHRKLVQSAGGRKGMYIAAHAKNVQGWDDERGLQYIWDLIEHTTQKKYTVRVPWLQVGDLIMWDNRKVMHRSTGGEFETKFKRDMRR